MRARRMRSRRDAVIVGVYEAIDFAAAILLLTGQITASGVFVGSGGLWVSLSGPIMGGRRLNGTTPLSNAVVDGIDIVLGLLLICGQLTVTGPWISSGAFTITLGGPALGVPTVPVPAIEASTAASNGFYRDFRRMLIAKFLGEDL